MNTELYINIAHMRLDDDAFVLVPLRRDYAQLARAARLEVLDELRSICRRERLQGHVVPVWFDEAGRLSFLADAALHGRLNTVTPARLRANLNRTLVVPAPTGDLRAVAGPIPELADVVMRSRPTTRPGVGPSAPVAASPPTNAVAPFSAPAGHEGGASSAAPPPPPPPPYGAPIAAYGVPQPYGARPVAPIGAPPPLAVAPAPAAVAPAPLAVASAPLDAGYASRASSATGLLGVGWAPPPPAAPFVAQAGAVPFAAARTMSRELPRRIVTMVFTDIVGSTELKQRAGEHGAMELIRWHHATVRDVLASTGGGEEISTAGDSFFLVFASPSDAVRFALLLQSCLRRGPGNGWFVLDRIGIHVGEVFLSDEVVAGKVRDFYGVQVDTCARVMSLGNADQILLTRFAAENARPALSGPSLPGVGALAWTHHGAYALKGVEGAIDVFEVGEAGVAPMIVPSADKRVAGGLGV